MQEQLYQEQKAFNTLKKGEEKGLDFFFNRYYSPLVIYATTLTNNSQIPKEIVSEAFVKLWNNRTSIEEWRKVKFWLYRIVYNASIDYLREQQTQKKQFKDYTLLATTSERAILDTLIETETYHKLYSLLNILPPRARQIFQLFYFQNKTIKQIAAQLGVSVNTVKTQKLRAINTLKEYKDSLYILLLFFFFS